MNSSSSSFSPIQSSSNPSSPRTDLPKGSADDKKAATRALYCFNSALREPEHIEALTDSLITEALLVPPMNSLVKITLHVSITLTEALLP